MFTTRWRRCFGFLSVLAFLTINSPCCFFFLMAICLGFFTQGNQGTTEKTITHTLMMNWPATQKTWKPQIIVETVWVMMSPAVLTSTFDSFSYDVGLFHKADFFFFYERPGFCFSMLHGEYATKTESNTTQYNNVRTLHQNNKNNHTISLHTIWWQSAILWQQAKLKYKLLNAPN